MATTWWTVAIQGVNFLVLAWLLQRFLYRPVQEVIARRRLQADEAAAALAKARNEADAMRLRHEQALAGIEAERNIALAGARTAIDAERRKAQDEARDAAAASLAEARSAIEGERRAALDAIRSRVVDLAGQMARTIIADLAPALPDDTILARFASEVKRLPEIERQRLASELAKTDGKVTIVSARRLDATSRSAWKSRLEQMLARPLTVDFEEDRSLLAGAELRLPQTSVRVAVVDQIERACEALRRGNGAELG